MRDPFYLPAWAVGGAARRRGAAAVPLGRARGARTSGSE